MYRLVPRLEGWSENRISERVRYLLDFVSLPPESFMLRYPSQLSGGQQQRVGLARALAMDPPLLLMDEPFGALDPILRHQLQDEFNSIKQEIGRTIVFVTHDIDEAFKLGDRIGIMADARLVQIGTPEELILEPANELVADIVEAKRKFKHIDNLRVKDLMSPLEGRYIFEASTALDTAVAEMSNNDQELAIVFDGPRLAGQVLMCDLLTSSGTTLGDIATTSLVFSPFDLVAAALEEMKRRKISTAIVMEGSRPLGLFLSDEVLMRLI